MREMKDSGIEWIGEIPKEWEVAKYKYFARSGMGRTILSTETKSCGIPIYSATQDKSLFGYIEETDLILNQGDLVIPARGNSIGYVKYITDQKATCTQTTIYSKIYGLDKKYVFYCCLGFDKIWYEYDDTAIPQITVMQVQNNILPLPKSDEQHRIADYLDDKCGKIDRYIEQQKQVIEKLKAYKQSVITEAVTKGLDPTVPMKDSGVEWIGEIPTKSVLMKLRFTLERIGDIDHTMPASVDNGVPYIMTGDLKDSISEIDFEKCKKVSFDDYFKLSQKMSAKNDDIVFARYATIGTVSYVDINKDFLVSYSCVTIRPDKSKLKGKFLFYFFKSNAFFEEVKKFINASTQGNVGIDSLYNVKIPLTSLENQDRIISYLDQKCSIIDSAIEKKQALIDKLTEYKKSLIYEVVTGKKEV
ncbi:MAG: restriction endonuclease subunit S [Oscillospiraceae bacterium]|nr:restriction endonuclease subunit S [Oscillospiraceae bacterium]